jgi:hypothetical protein
LIVSGEAENLSFELVVNRLNPGVIPEPQKNGCNYQNHNQKLQQEKPVHGIQPKKEPLPTHGVKVGQSVAKNRKTGVAKRHEKRHKTSH